MPGIARASFFPSQEQSCPEINPCSINCPRLSPLAEFGRNFPEKLTLTRCPKIQTSFTSRKARGHLQVTNGNRGPGTAPPYVSYKSWDTFLAYLKTNLMPVPERLDTSVWRQSPFSGSTKSGLQGALTFLGLTDSAGTTLGRLTNLAEAESSEAQRRILASIYEERYAPILGEIDPARATRQQIHGAFRSAGSANATAEVFSLISPETRVSMSTQTFSPGDRGQELGVERAQTEMA